MNLTIKFISTDYFEASRNGKPLGFGQFNRWGKCWSVNYTAKSEVYTVRTIEEAIDVFSDDEPVDIE